MKRITKTAWFGKRILGWGYRPVSLEGWVVTVVFLIAIFADFAYYHRTIISYAILKRKCFLEVVKFFWSEI